jgi:hypothetical protein
MKIHYLKSVQVVALSFLVVVLGLFSCQSNSNSDTKTEQGNKNQEVKIAEENQEMTVSFAISNVEDDINGAKSTIIATINGKNVEVTQTTNCNALVEKEEYESKNVPDDAMWACSCWWAGAGSDFYAKKTNEKVEVYKKEVYEEIKTEDEKWELFKTLE